MGIALVLGNGAGAGYGSRGIDDGFPRRRRAFANRSIGLCERLMKATHRSATADAVLQGPTTSKVPRARQIPRPVALTNWTPLRPQTGLQSRPACQPFHKLSRRQRP